MSLGITFLNVDEVEDAVTVSFELTLDLGLVARQQGQVLAAPLESSFLSIERSSSV